ncbi:transcription factor SPT20 homolog [Panonychus citri]|uniref:transcription factor SPT20 homolog n=1 Tax=Panonychus citri TaxID=50023 RepID=UPI002307EC0F|nr:transcription factor SPT20 homolog [Panonychus citri]
MDQIFTSEIEPKLEVQVSQRDQLGTGDIQRLNQSMQQVKKQLKLILNFPSSKGNRKRVNSIMKCYRKTMVTVLKKGSKFARKRKQTVKSSSNRQTSTQKITQQEKVTLSSVASSGASQLRVTSIGDSGDSVTRRQILVASGVQPRVIVAMSGQQQPQQQGQQMQIKQQIQGVQINQSGSGGVGTQSQSQQMNSVMGQLITMLKSPSSQQNQRTVISILQSNPKLMAAFLKQRQASSQSSQNQAQNQLFQQINSQQPQQIPSQPPSQQQQQQRTMLAQQQKPQQIPPQLYSQQPIQGAQINQSGSGGVGTQSQSQQMNSVMGQLIAMLKSPTSQQNQKTVISILQSNPKLMAAFLKKRQASSQSSQNQAQNQLFQQINPQQPQQTPPQPPSNQQQQQQTPSQVTQQQQQPQQIAFQPYSQRPIQGAQINQSGSGGVGTQSQSQQMNSVMGQLIAMLKSPTSQQNQKTVISILQSNPKLMAAFLKQRQASSQSSQNQAQNQLFQ